MNVLNDVSVNLKRLTSVKQMNSHNKPTSIVTVSPSFLHHFLLFCLPFKNRRIPSVSVFLEDGSLAASPPPPPPSAGGRRCPPKGFTVGQQKLLGQNRGES